MIAERVLIQGGGIGGLVTAAALAQHGVAVDVVEHRPASPALGVGLIQPANALRVMAEIGVLDDCLAAGYPGGGLRVTASTPGTSGGGRGRPSCRATRRR